MGALFSLRWLGLPTSRCAGLPRKFGASLTVSEMVAAEHYARGDVAKQAQSRRAGPWSPCRSDRGARPNGSGTPRAGLGRRDDRHQHGLPGEKGHEWLCWIAFDARHGLAISLIRATVAAVHIPVTLKMRLGWDEQTINAPELGRVAEGEGIAMLTVHGRARCQFYSAKADWTAIAEVKKAVSIPVAANGDCASLADAASMLAQSGADAVMIGRSTIGRPWFVGDVAHFLTHGKARTGTPLAERKSAALEHFETLLEMFGPSHGLRHGESNNGQRVDLTSLGHSTLTRRWRREAPSRTPAEAA